MQKNSDLVEILTSLEDFLLFLTFLFRPNHQYKQRKFIKSIVINKGTIASNHITLIDGRL